MYLLSATLRRYKADADKADDIFISYIGDWQLRIMQNAYNEIAANLFTNPLVNFLFKPVKWYMTINSLGRGVSDKLSRDLAHSIASRGEIRDRLIDGIYYSKRYQEIEDAMRLNEESAGIVQKIKNAIKNAKLPKQSVYSLIDEALKTGIITADEKNLLERAKDAKEAVVQVDGFMIDEYLKREI